MSDLLACAASCPDLIDYGIEYSGVKALELGNIEAIEDHYLNPSPPGVVGDIFNGWFNLISKCEEYLLLPSSSKIQLLCVQPIQLPFTLTAFRLKLPLPDVYVTEDPTYNAYATGFYRFGFIVLHSSLVRDFKPPELLFIIGHEMGHMKRHHTTWLSLLQPVRKGSARFFLAPLMRVIFNVWSVKAEYTADQAGLTAGRDLDAACRCLLKLAAGSNSEKEVDLSTILSMKNESEEILTNLAEYLGTHPFIQNRVRHLVSFASSAQYQSTCAS